jgi:hypothetical protein
VLAFKPGLIAIKVLILGYKHLSIRLSVRLFGLRRWSRWTFKEIFWLSATMERLVRIRFFICALISDRETVHDVEEDVEEDLGTFEVASRSSRS